MVLMLYLLPGALAAAAADEGPQRGDFLVAARHLEDPNFAEAVVLIVEHTSVGSLGVIVNHPTGVPLARAVPALAEFDDQDHKLYFGGPVSTESLSYVTREAPPGPAMALVEEVFLGGSLSGLRTLLEQRVSKTDLRVFGGYAGWAPGQLQVEQARGDWFLARGSAAEVFAPNPHQVWRRLIDRFDPPGLLTRAPSARAQPLPGPRRRAGTVAAIGVNWRGDCCKP